MDNDSIMQLVTGLAARHAMTVAAGSLVTLGLLHSGADETNFIQLGSGILVGAVALLWSWWQKSGQRTVAAALKRVTGREKTSAAVAVAAVVPVGAALPLAAGQPQQAQGGQKS